MSLPGTGGPADHLDADVLVIGAGIAGLCAALAALPRRVLLLCPDDPIRSSSSALAQGGIAAALGADDSVDLHVHDTLAVAADAADPIVVARVVNEAAGVIAYLERLGVKFDRDGTGRSLHLEAGHSRPRVVHAAGDRSGATIVGALWAAAAQASHIELVSGWRAVELVPAAEGIAGAVAVNAGGEQRIILARDTVLATGGLGQLFELTTNGPDATGDGLAMALAAGASVAALEFVQFHPTALKVAADPLPLLTEALRGAGARLVTADGRLIMAGRHRLGDLAPRDVVARTVYEYTQMGDPVFLDARSVFASGRAAQFPGARTTALHYRLDAVRDLLPVTAAAHYHMGGISVDERGRTSLPGLWACGEVTCTGLHGANRLASNSLLEAVVFGRAVGSALSASPSSLRQPRSSWHLDDGPGENPGAVTMRLRGWLWHALGPLRDHATLATAIEDVTAERVSVNVSQRLLRRRLELALAMLRAAAVREESRGAHWRRDFPTRDADRDGARDAGRMRRARS